MWEAANAWCWGTRLLISLPGGYEQVAGNRKVQLVEGVARVQVSKSRTMVVQRRPHLDKGCPDLYVILVWLQRYAGIRTQTRKLLQLLAAATDISNTGRARVPSGHKGNA